MGSRLGEDRAGAGVGAVAVSARWAGWVLLVGCAGDVDERSFRLGVRLGPDLEQAVEPELWTAQLAVGAVRLRPCRTNEVEPVTVGLGEEQRPRRLVQDIGFSPAVSRPDVVQPTARAVLLPRGGWCGADVLLAGPLRLTGVESSGGSFEVELLLPHAQVEVPAGFGDLALTLEIGREAWLAPMASALGAGEQVRVAPGDAAHDAWAAAVWAGSGLYATEDPQAALSDEEHAAGPIAPLVALEGALLP